MSDKTRSKRTLSATAAKTIDGRRRFGAEGIDSVVEHICGLNWKCHHVTTTSCRYSHVMFRLVLVGSFGLCWFTRSWPLALAPVGLI